MVCCCHAPWNGVKSSHLYPEPFNRFPRRGWHDQCQFQPPTVNFEPHLQRKRQKLLHSTSTRIPDEKTHTHRERERASLPDVFFVKDMVSEGKSLLNYRRSLIFNLQLSNQIMQAIQLAKLGRLSPWVVSKVVLFVSEKLKILIRSKKSKLIYFK